LDKFIDFSEKQQIETSKKIYNTIIIRCKLIYVNSYILISNGCEKHDCNQKNDKNITKIKFESMDTDEQIAAIHRMHNSIIEIIYIVCMHVIYVVHTGADCYICFFVWIFHWPETWKPDVRLISLNTVSMHLIVSIYICISINIVYEVHWSLNVHCSFIYLYTVSLCWFWIDKLNWIELIFSSFF
jgi:hypothetical protein